MNLKSWEGRLVSVSDQGITVRGMEKTKGYRGARKRISRLEVRALQARKERADWFCSRDRRRVPGPRTQRVSPHAGIVVLRRARGSGRRTGLHPPQPKFIQ